MSELVPASHTAQGTGVAVELASLLVIEHAALEAAILVHNNAHS